MNKHWFTSEKLLFAIYMRYKIKKHPTRLKVSVTGYDVVFTQ